ncbi:hypothetical protein OsI_12625 [Oryza sativa Indica Group]|uniref:Uncharacterized protein n=1 Tax=Oryza sativa subsp. indica TaxID=39946 RepID=B8AMJ9_ORYSI|nr:hypothetical protein OsI_12625 [Oryza sativa Indica Group]
MAGGLTRFSAGSRADHQVPAHQDRRRHHQAPPVIHDARRLLHSTARPLHQARPRPGHTTAATAPARCTTSSARCTAAAAASGPGGGSARSAAAAAPTGSPGTVAAGTRRAGKKSVLDAGGHRVGHLRRLSYGFPPPPEEQTLVQTRDGPRTDHEVIMALAMGATVDELLGPKHGEPGESSPFPAPAAEPCSISGGGDIFWTASGVVPCPDMAMAFPAPPAGEFSWDKELAWIRELLSGSRPSSCSAV